MNIDNRAVKILYLSWVFAVAVTMLGVFFTMYASPNGMVYIYEHNLLIRNSEIVMLFFLLGYTFKEMAVLVRDWFD